MIAPSRSTSRIRVAGELHLLLRGLPHLGLLHPVADDQADQGGDDAQAEQPSPRQPEPVDHHQRGDARQQVAERVPLLQQPREEPASLDGNLLHGERGTQPPLAAHADAVKQAQDDQHGEVRRERAQEAHHGIKHDVDHQRQPPADSVGPQPEEQCTDGPHDQSGRGDERDLGLAVVERLGDVGIDEHHDEVVEGVHRPAQ
jgi:hypothetical protein